MGEQERVYKYAFMRREKRQPEDWELTLGLALVQGTLVVQFLPDAETLRRVHYAAHWTRLALNIA